MDNTERSSGYDFYAPLDNTEIPAADGTEGSFTGPDIPHYTPQSPPPAAELPPQPAEDVPYSYDLRYLGGTAVGEPANEDPPAPGDIQPVQSPETADTHQTGDDEDGSASFFDDATLRELLEEWREEIFPGGAAGDQPEAGGPFDGPPIDPPDDKAPPGEAGDGNESSRVTPETRNAFHETVQVLEESGSVPTTENRDDYLKTTIGDPDGAHARVTCEVVEDQTPKRLFPTTYRVSVTIATTPPPEAIDSADTTPAIAVSLDSSRSARTFSDGTITNHNMSADEYEQAVREIQAHVGSKVWGWIQTAQQVGSTAQPSELPELAKQLLNLAGGAGLSVDRSTKYEKTFNNNTSGDTAIVSWRDGTRTHRVWESERTPAKQIKLRLSSGEAYVYRNFVDGTEQLWAETWDDDIRAKLAAEGFPAVIPGQGIGVSAASRRLGFHRPTETAMARFNSLLRRITGLDD